MKYFLSVFTIVVLSFFAPSHVFAQPIDPTIFFCVGNDLKPPCVTRSPLPTQTSISTAPSPASPSVSNPDGSGNPSSSTEVSSTPSHALLHQL